MMNISRIVVGALFSVFLCGCYAPGYIPEAESLDVNPYGSYIEISTVQGPNISGELLAVNEDGMMVLIDPSMRQHGIIITPHTAIRSYTLRYAQPENHGWSIPLYSLSTISHGLYLVFTFPVNLITTIAVTAGGSVSYTYSDDDITLDELKMFARFPQGIPEHVDLEQIR